MPPTYRRKRKLTMPGQAESPRNQAVYDPESQLPRLTVKQERFVKHILDGKTAREAYRLAYDCSNMSEDSIAVESSKLSRESKISLSIRIRQRIGLEVVGITKESHLAELARGREIAYDLGQASAGIQAEHYRGRVAGLYNDKLSVTVGPSDDMLLSQIASLLGPEMAQVIGKAIGFDTQGETIELSPSTDSELLSLPGPLETPRESDG